MKQRAVEHYLEHGKSLVRTMRALGYPKSREVLGDWIDEIAPGQRKYRGPNPKTPPIPIEKKVQVVAELEARTGPAAVIAERHGVSRTAPYFWRRAMMGDNDGGPERKGEPVSKELDDLPDDIEQLQDMLREAKMQLRKVQLELDVRQATLEIVKKDPGADPDRLANAEKAAMVTALRTKYKLCELLPRGGHGQEQLRVREERAAQRRDRGTRGRQGGGNSGVRIQRRHLRLQAHRRRGQRRVWI